jgi:hypothetical protein
MERKRKMRGNATKYTIGKRDKDDNYFGFYGYLKIFFGIFGLKRGIKITLSKPTQQRTGSTNESVTGRAKIPPQRS